MTAGRFYSGALIALVLVLGYLTYRIVSPFLAPIAWAIVLSIVFYPLHLYLLRYIKWRAVSSLVVLLVIIVVIVGPFSYISYLLVNEVRDITSSMNSDKMDSLSGILSHPSIRELLKGAAGIFNIGATEADMRKTIADYVTRWGKELFTLIPGGLSNVVTVAADFVIMAFSIFFILKDSAAFLGKIRDFMPFSEEQKDRLGRQINGIIVSTIYGGVVVAVVQGIIGGVSYAVLGMRSPVLWGLATAVASFVPLFGTAVVWGTICLYYIFTGMTAKAVILLVIGVFCISMVDSVLKPLIIGARTRMHILVIFFSVLGGINLFGLIGLIMGPLVVALFLSVLEIYKTFEGEDNGAHG